MELIFNIYMENIYIDRYLACDVRENVSHTQCRRAEQF